MRSTTAGAFGGSSNSQQEGARGGALFVAAPGVAKLAECRLLDNVAEIFVAAVSASGGALYIEGSTGSATSQSAEATLTSCTSRNSTALLAGLWYVVVAVPSQADTRSSSIGVTGSRRSPFPYVKRVKGTVRVLKRAARCDARHRNPESSAACVHVEHGSLGKQCTIVGRWGSLASLSSKSLDR